MRINNSKKSFTLIELLVVIAVIGLLASISLVYLGGARKKARDARRQSDMRAISTAMEMAYDDSASDCGGLDSYITSAGIPGKICTNDGQYLDPVPGDPVGGVNYNWRDNTTGDCTAVTPSISSGQWYCAYASLEAEDAYFVATQRGTKKIDTEPTDCNCGW